MRRGIVDLNLMVVFDAIERERSLTRAAKRLNTTPSAISHALARLRGATGDDLFLRTPDGMEPTLRATAMTGSVRAALDLMDAALAPAFDPATARNSFTLGLDNRCALVLAAPLARRVAEAAPGMTLELVPCGTFGLAERLDRNGLDLAATCVAPEAGNCERCVLFDDGYVVLLRRDHPALGPHGLTTAALADFPHLALTSISESDEFVDEHLGEANLQRHVALRAPLHAADAILVASDLLAVVGRRTARAFGRSEELVAVPLPFDAPCSTTSLVWHRRWTGMPAHRWLRGVIEDVARLID